MAKVRTEQEQGVEMPQPTARGELVVRDQAKVIADVLAMPDEHKTAVASFLNINADNPALPAYLALCIQHNLSPFLGEIWLIPQRVKVRNAEGVPEEVERLRPAAGRDGFLSVGQKSGSWMGLQSDVVCANDRFEVDWNVDPSVAPRIVHKHAPMKPGENERDYRGAIIGAWAKAYRRDAYPVFYFAPLKEHGKVGHGSRGAYWKGAWAYTSGMICKAAESMVLRKAYSITGVVPMDELRVDPNMALEGGEAIPVPEADEFEGVNWGASEEVRERLRAAVDRANEADPWSWNAAKCQMMFHEKPDEELLVIAEQIEREAAEAEGTAAVKTEGGDDGIPDAEVVRDEPVGQVEEEDPDEKIAGLQARLRELTNRMNDCDPGSEEHRALAEEADLVNREIAQRKPPAGQGELGVGDE